MPDDREMTPETCTMGLPSQMCRDSAWDRRRCQEVASRPRRPPPAYRLGQGDGQNIGLERGDVHETAAFHEADSVVRLDPGGVTPRTTRRILGEHGWRVKRAASTQNFTGDAGGADVADGVGVGL